MTKEDRAVQRKLKVLRHAEKTGYVARTQTPPEVVDKILYLRSKYHLGSTRIVWYLARYHGITISDAGVTRILRRNGVGRLPRGTRTRRLQRQNTL